MTTQGDTRETTAQVSRLVATEDKEGKKQWEVQVRWPWTPANNKGGDKTYVYREQIPQWDADTKGAFNLLVEAGYTKKDSKASQQSDENPEGKIVYFDGSRDWMWYWRIIREIDHAPVQAAAPASNGYRDQGYDQRITWNSAVNNAVHLLAYHPHYVDIVPTVPLKEALPALAMEVYAIIAAGPPQHAPAGRREAADDLFPPEAEEPAQRPKPDPARAVSASVEIWNKANPGREISRELIQNACFKIFGVGEKDALASMKALTPDQAATLSGLIARGEIWDAIEKKQGRP